MTQTANANAAPADAPPGNWVDAWAPAFARPYLRLMRADRPIGTWLLLIPCWQGMALATAMDGRAIPNLWHAILFAVGAYVMRGAGCTYNDIVDRDIDGKVARTALRPIPSGQVSVQRAWAFLVAQCLVGLVVLLQFGQTAIVTGLAALALVAAYPFMKRITYWPQAWLGLTFNWGVLVGFAAEADRLALPAFIFYFGSIAWTIVYDTIYACQDKEDDALIGVKSTARLFGRATRPLTALFAVVYLAALAAAGVAAGLGPVFFAALAAPAAHFAWQMLRFAPDDGPVCLKLFRSNRDAALLVLAAILAGGAAAAYG